MTNTMRLQGDTAIIRLVSVGALIQSMEFFIPYPVPGVKIGFANIIAVLAVYNLNFKEAFVVSLLRPVAGSIITGTFLSAGFIISFVASIASFLMMWSLFRVEAIFHLFSIYGLSIAGAVVHNLSQLAVVYLWLLRIPEILYLSPILMLGALVSGAFIGHCSAHILPKVEFKKNYPAAKALAPEVKYEAKSKIKLFSAVLLASSTFISGNIVYYIAVNASIMLFIHIDSGLKFRQYLKFIPLLAFFIFFPAIFRRDIAQGLLAALRVLLLFHISIWVSRDLRSALGSLRTANPVGSSSVVNASVLLKGPKRLLFLIISSVAAATTLTQKIKKPEVKTLRGLRDAIIGILNVD